METNQTLVRLLLQKAEGIEVDLSEYSDDEVLYHYYLLFENKSTEEMEVLKKELSSEGPGN